MSLGGTFTTNEQTTAKYQYTSPVVSYIGYAIVSSKNILLIGLDVQYIPTRVVCRVLASLPISDYDRRNFPADDVPVDAAISADTASIFLLLMLFRLQRRCSIF